MKFNVKRFTYEWSAPFDFELNGSGTVDDPYLIEIVETHHYDIKEHNITLSNSLDYIKFNKINIRVLHLINSANISISNAKLRNLILENCSKISINNSIMTKRLRLSDATQINISNCQIENLSALSGDQILILDSNVKNISKNSKANIQFQE